MSICPKIDIHAHVTIYPDLAIPSQGTGQRFLSPEELLRIYDDLNIEKGVLLPLIAPEGQYIQMTNEGCILAARAYPDRFVWFCSVDPRAGANRPDADLSYMLNFYKDLGARGLGELTANMYVDDPRMDNLLTHCEACQLPVMIHISPAPGVIYGIVDELGLPRLEKALKKHPKLNIIGHSQPFWAEMSGNVTEEMRNDYPTGKVTEGRLHQLLRENKNLFCDLSAGSGANALMRDRENAVRFLNEFSDQILYGCDICGRFDDQQYKLSAFLDELVESGDLSEETYRKIVRGNAIRLLKLDCE